jgi:hypothetical protein
MIPTNLELIQTYAKLKSVHKVAKAFGITHSVVHRRLKKLPCYHPRQPAFTEAQIDRIKEYYTITPDADFDLGVLVAEIGKEKSLISGRARLLGLSNISRPKNAEARARFKRHRWDNKPHPRGMAGKNHSRETLKQLSFLSKKRWATWKELGTGCMAPEARDALSKRMSIRQSKRRADQIYTWAAGGHREDLNGTYFRSAWEANYARYLNLLVKMKVVEYWAFEPETFWFENIRRGTRSFLIDFKVKYANEDKPVYVEIKGYMDKKSKTKISRFRKYYPQHRLEVIGAKEYYALRDRWSSAISTWEFPKPRTRPPR